MKDKVVIKNVKNLTNTDKDVLLFAEHLQMFINNSSDNKEHQKKMLDAATEQFKNLTEFINPGCKKCFGRGHVGFSSTTEQFIYCPQCFKPTKINENLRSNPNTRRRP